MSDYFRPKTCQASRKDRRCIACYGPIVKGEVYTQQTGIFDGRAFRNDFHNECYESLAEEGEFEFCPGELDWPDRVKASAPTKAEGASK